jgi:tRNA(fMet)-specific endonuclease VapC
MNGPQTDCIADTSAIIGLARNDSRAIEALRERNFAITFVTFAELILGTLKSSNPAAWSGVERVIRNRQMFEVSTVTPAIYARIYFELEQRGNLIPINDIWIAALALETGLPIVARDEHFARISGLEVIPC